MMINGRTVVSCEYGCCTDFGYGKAAKKLIKKSVKAKERQAMFREDYRD